MGIRKPRRKYKRPRKRWDKARILYEKELIKKYGFRRKKEIWRLQAEFRKLRIRIRNYLATKDEKEREVIWKKLFRLGLINSLDASTDEVLSLTPEDLFERRLQTIVYKKGLAKTIKHARQLIAHRKIRINGIIATSPNRIVLREEEDKIELVEKKKAEEKNQEVQSQEQVESQEISQPQTQN